MAQLSNCVRCDSLFVRGVKDICPKCVMEVEKEYELCAKFLRKRENRGATIQDVSDATGVSVKQITRFIREGRISIDNNPNLGYPCENCGKLIGSGHLCPECAGELKREITQQLDVEKRLEQEEKERRRVGYHGKDSE
jgi:flagellar operon protein (TIGR03826 family)